MRGAEKRQLAAVVDKGHPAIPRKRSGGAAISASAVRQYIQRGDFDALKALLPASGYAYFISDEAPLVIARIQNAPNVAHY